MDVATLCTTYQKKMWKSMITRKKLPYSIWDAIDFKNAPVYYMPYSGIHRFEIDTRYCRKCNVELDIRIRHNQFIAHTCMCSADGKTFATRFKLESLFDEITATYIINIFNQHKTRKFPNKLAYWTNLGYSEDEALLKVQEVQTSRSLVSPASQQGAIEYTPRRPEFWINKGYTPDDATKQVATFQVKNGISWYVTKYGKIEGQIKYKQRMKRWMIAYNLALENDPTINERKMTKLGRASKASLAIFQPIYEQYKDDYSIYLGVDDNIEYFLRDNNTLYFYDFVIPELRIIVEYNGSKFHPNKATLTEPEWRDWKCVYSELDADTAFMKDCIKQQLAIANGYTFLTIWDTDPIDASIRTIIDMIEN